MESYQDKRRASYHDEFHAAVKELHEDYIRPQENGSHDDCDYVKAEGSRIQPGSSGRRYLCLQCVCIHTGGADGKGT